MKGVITSDFINIIIDFFQCHDAKFASKPFRTYLEHHGYEVEKELTPKEKALDILEKCKSSIVNPGAYPGLKKAIENIKEG